MQKLHSIMINFSEELTIYPVKEVNSIIIPGPPQVISNIKKFM
jgi:hypothetical protein